MSTGNLICLYRIHELVLNRLLSRFQEGIIPDLTAYFEETWVLPVYHDRFPAFMERQRRLMIEAALHHTGQYTDTKKLLEQLRDYATKNPHSLSMPEEERRNLYTAFDQSPDRKMMDESLRSYLVDVVPQE